MTGHDGAQRRVPWAGDSVGRADVTVQGFDIAGYQPVAFNTAGIDFVIIKITEGTNYINPNWTGQRATARAHNLVTGFYHFVRPGSMIAQADFFLKQFTLQPGDVLAFDWEDTGVSGAQKDAWIKYVQSKAPGHRVLLYCNRDFWNNRQSSNFAGDGLWIADPSSPAGHPQVSAPWLMHQYGGAGGYDHDVAQFDSRAAMAAWAEGTSIMTAMDITPAGADLVASRFLAGQHDDPTTPAGTTSMGGMIWNTGKNASWAYNATQEIKTSVVALDAKLTALSTAVNGISGKLDKLQTSVTDPSGLISQIRTELESFKLVLQQTTPGA
jgi:hypothetical protein